MDETVQYEHTAERNGVSILIRIWSRNGSKWRVYRWDKNLDHDAGGWRNWGVTQGRQWHNPEQAKSFLAEKGWVVQ